MNFEFSEEQKFDSKYTVFEDDKQQTRPIGMTPAAAEKLLRQLGFLIDTTNQPVQKFEEEQS